MKSKHAEIIELRDSLRIEDTRLVAELEALSDRLRSWELGVPIALGVAIWRRAKGEWKLTEADPKAGANVPFKDASRMVRLEFLEMIAEHGLENLVEAELRKHLLRRTAVTTKALSAPQETEKEDDDD